MLSCVVLAGCSLLLYVAAVVCYVLLFVVARVCCRCLVCVAAAQRCLLCVAYCYCQMLCAVRRLVLFGVDCVVACCLSLSAAVTYRLQLFVVVACFCCML